MNQRDQANILMVDDQAGKLLSYETILGELGENLIKARSAREAMEQLLRNDIAVVLMDVSMPEINGFELADMMHRHPRFQKTAIIFISAVHLSDPDRIKGYQSGAVDYIAVPIVPELLRAKVSVFTELHRKTRQLEQLNRELEQRVEERTEQLRQSEEQFRTLANSIPQLAWMADAQGSIFWYNQRWYDYIGLGEEEIVRWGWTSLQHPDHVGRTMERLKQAWNAGELWEDTLPLLGKDERYKWFIARAVPLRDFQGSVVRWFGTCTDISDQIAAEEKIRHLNSQLQQRLAELETIMQVLPVGVAVSQDAACDVITGNAALNQILGTELGDNISLNEAGLSALSFRIFQDGKELTSAEFPLQRSASSGQQLGSMEMEIRHKSGSITHLLASASPLRDPAGAVRGAVGAFFDVTGRRRLEDLLRERADLLELATEGIIVRDLNGRLLYWNSGAEALYGWKRDEVLGKPIHEILKTHFPVGDNEIELALAGTGSWEGNLTQTTRDGRELVVASRLALKTQGEAVLEINRDITAQLQAEEALRKAERLAAMGRVAGIIAHEINNPLEAISNTFFLLRDHPSLDEEARHYAQMGEEEMLRLSHITRQTLGFYRESKQPVEVSIADLLNDVLELQLRRMEFDKIAVEKRYRSQGNVQGFPVELKQVFLNLIGNAVQAMPDGGKLRLHVFESGRRDNLSAGTWISVCDTGVGIDAEHAKHLFEPFFTTKSTKGTGLGLWISKGIIQKYGGSISFRSLHGSGRNITCFRIFLPHADLGAVERTDIVPDSRKLAEPAGRSYGRA
ncbi:MAG TPA: PAS domain S-box protein [Terracidiphilus sp.]|jgi:PAS domain S-box-containing protein